MDKSIIEHQKYIESKLTEKLGNSEREGLRRCHEQRVRDFQHERLVHLIVTLFFAVLLIVALVAFLAISGSLLQTLFGILVIILLPLEITYVWHYYKLENGVQGLYQITDKINR